MSKRKGVWCGDVRVRELRVGARLYRVRVRGEDLLATDPAMGAIQHGTGLIEVAGWMSPDGQSLTLLHEVVHAIADNAVGSVVDNLTSEQWADMIASGMLGFARDNPEAWCALSRRRGAGG